MNRITFDIPKPIEEVKTQYDMRKVSFVTSANLYPLVKGFEYDGDITQILEKKRVFPIKRKMDVAIDAYRNDMLKEWEKAKKKLLALRNGVKRFKKMDYNNVQTIDRIARIPFQYKKLFVEVANKYDLNLGILDKIVINSSLLVNARYDSRYNLIELNPDYLKQHGMIRIGDSGELISETAKTFIHEFAHVTWYNSLTEEDRGYWASLSKFYTREQLTGDMTQFVVGEKKRFDGSTMYSPFYTNRGDSFVSVYARFNMREDFAECFLYYKVDPKTLERIDAKKYAFMVAKIGSKITKYGTSEGAEKAWDTRGRGRKEEENKGKYLYHVTNTDKVDSIKEKGIVPLQTSNWVQAGNKERYGKGEIFTFEDPADAVRWATKMDWEFNKDTSSGKISIVRIKNSGDWTIDDADPMSQLGSRGNWLKSVSRVESKDVVDSVPVTSDMVKRLVSGRGSKGELPDMHDIFSTKTEKLLKQDELDEVIEEEFQPEIEEPNRVREKIIAILAGLNDSLSYSAREHIKNAYELGKQKGGYYTDATILSSLSQADKDEIKRILDRNDRYLDNFMDNVVDGYDNVLFNMTSAGMVESAKTYDDIDEFDSEFEGVMDNQEHRLGIYAINGLGLGLMAGMISMVDESFAGGYWHTTVDGRQCDGCMSLDNKWMSFDEFYTLYGKNECDGNCRCGELFEPALAPGDSFEMMMKGGEGSGIKGHTTSKDDNKKEYDNLWARITEMQTSRDNSTSDDKRSLAQIDRRIGELSYKAISQYKAEHGEMSDADAVKALERNREMIVKGGQGSGNFDHAGRPGEVGGSTSSGGIRDTQEFKDALKDRIAGLESSLGIEPGTLKEYDKELAAKGVEKTFAEEKALKERAERESKWSDVEKKSDKLATNIADNFKDMISSVAKEKDIQSNFDFAQLKNIADKVVAEHVKDELIDGESMMRSILNQWFKLQSGSKYSGFGPLSISMRVSKDEKLWSRVFSGVGSLKIAMREEKLKNKGQKSKNTEKLLKYGTTEGAIAGWDTRGRSSRGHIESGREDTPEPERDWRTRIIARDTGFDEETSGKIERAIYRFTNHNYDEIRVAQGGTSYPARKEFMTDSEMAKWKEAGDYIEKYIEKAPKFEGEIYRGIRGESVIDIMDKIKPNDIIDMKGTSSWSSEKKVAETRENGGITFYCKDVIKSTGVDHLSSMQGEKEVFVSKEARFRVKNIGSDFVPKEKEFGWDAKQGHFTTNKTSLYVELEEIR